jgi:tol-pal system protein YbgF
MLPAAAQSNEDLSNQIQRLQRDMRDLQAEIFRNGGPRPGVPAPQPPVDLTPAPSTTQMQRLDDIEESLRRLTGELEQFTHELNQLSQKTDRLQRQLDFVEQNAQAAARTPDDAPPADELAPRDATRGPALGSLGTLPSGNRPLRGTAPTPPASPEAEFDNAMDLLARAQYDRASEAFRAFADGFPDNELAPQALYWTGDIAYSTRRDYAGAARDFAELLKKYPDAQRAPESMLKLGLSLLALGQKQEGCAALAALPAKYPDAPPPIVNRSRAERRTAACG